MDDELVRRRLQWRADKIGRFMRWFGPVSSVLDIATFAAMWFVFHANTPARQALFQSGRFVVGLLTLTLVVHKLRTPRLPIVQSRAATPLLATSLAIVASGLWLPMGVLAPAFGLVPRPPSKFAWGAILLGCEALATAMKHRYNRRFGWQ